jgi:hypothetical protein
MIIRLIRNAWLDKDAYKDYVTALSDMNLDRFSLKCGDG